MIPEETVREVRERIAILDLVSDYVSLKKSGSNYQGLCPFHSEKTPSFSVNPSKGIFHCFGCGTGGNAFSFIMRMEGLSFPEAIRFLARRAGVPIEEKPLTSAEQKRRDEREELFRITDIAVQFYRSQLLSSEEGAECREYLARRGVDLATAEAYRLGFAPGKWDALTRHLERRTIGPELAEKLGLLRRRDGGGFYDTFRNRLLFTITDLHGRPVAFGGRVLDDSLPKYINSPESPIYHKGDILFGLDLAKQSIREKGAALVVEGYFDHLSLYQAGARNVVATCGTSLTVDHIKLLKRYAERLYMLFDSDSAGRRATIRAMDMVLPEGVPVSVIELPPGDDPDSFVKREGGDAFADRVKTARPILEQYLRYLIDSEGAGTIEGKRKIIAELVPRLRLIGDRIQRNLYVSEIARILGMEESWLRQETGLAEPRRTGGVPAPQQPVRKGGSGSAEMLLLLIATYPELAAKAAERNVAEMLPASYSLLAEAIIAETLAAHGQCDLGGILHRFSVEGEESPFVSIFVNDACLEGVDPHKAFDQCCMSLQRQPLRDIKVLSRELARIEPDTPRYKELLDEIETLRNKKSLLS